MVRILRRVMACLLFVLPLACTPVYPWIESCAYKGEIYEHGARLLLDNGCERCVCVFDSWRCSVDACDTVCGYEGRVFVVGQVFAHSDGCNDCVCLIGNVVACTENLCDPSQRY